MDRSVVVSLDRVPDRRYKLGVEGPSLTFTVQDVRADCEFAWFGEISQGGYGGEIWYPEIERPGEPECFCIDAPTVQEALDQACAFWEALLAYHPVFRDPL